MCFWHTARMSSAFGYRHPRRGAWGFSNRTQGYVVSDCTAEAIKAVVTLQTLRDAADPSHPIFPTLVSEQRQKWAVDVGIEAEFPEAGIEEGYMTFTNEEILQCFEPVVNRILELVRNQIIAIQAQNRSLQVSPTE